MHTRPSSQPSEPTDGDLVRRARAGAQEAFTVLVRRYQGLAIARAYALLSDRAEAEDVAQEAFLRVFRALHQLRRPGSFAPWLLQTVTNVARRTLSKRARRPGPLLDAEPSHDPPPRPELLDAIAALPEGDQQVLHLHYSQGYSCAEIARLLGLQLGSVTSRLSRARQKLREMLSEDDR